MIAWLLYLIAFVLALCAVLSETWVQSALFIIVATLAAIAGFLMVREDV